MDTGVPPRESPSGATLSTLSEELSKALDPGSLDPHKVTVEMEVGSSELMLYG